MASPSKKKLSQREIILGYATLVVVLVGYFKFWYGVKNSEITDFNRKIDAIQVEVDRNKQVVDGLQKRMMASTIDTEAESSLKGYMLSSRSLAQFVQHLISEDTNLVTRLIQIEKAEDNADFKEVSVLVELEGSFPGIGAFVERLEGSSMLAEVTDFDIWRVEGDLEKCVGKFSVSARIFPDTHGVKK